MPIKYFDWKDKRSLVNFVGLEETVTEMGTGCLRTMKSYHICIKYLKGSFLLSIKKYDSVYKMV